MNRMSEKLAVYARAQRAEAKLTEVKGQAAQWERTAVDLAEDLLAVAGELVKSAEFLDWLMDQDLSCAGLGKPSKKIPGNLRVDEASDITLALAYARRIS